MVISPFSENYRKSGILLHVTSLPTPYGIGDLGLAAQGWVDLLAESGQGWWQMLPLGSTGHGNCPYQLVSTFGGNPLLISPDLLVSEGILRRSDIEHGPAICIASLPPGGLSHARYLCKRLREASPQIAIIVGRWSQNPNSRIEREQLEQAGASFVTTTLLETRQLLESRLPLMIRESQTALMAR